MELSSAGWPIWYGQFTPYGQEITSVPTDFKYKFTGKERDQESGLDYFGARYYANTLNTSISSTIYHLDFGRWMSPDWSDKPEEVPYSILTDPQSLNLYSYVRNHPITAVDADGHVPEWLKGVGDGFANFVVGTVQGVSTLAKASSGDLQAATAMSQQFISLALDAKALANDPANLGKDLATGWSLTSTRDKAAMITEGALIAGTAVLGGKGGGATAAEEGEGIIYQRTNPTTGENYIGQSKSYERYVTRQGEHDSSLGVQHNYKMLERNVPNRELNMREESHIRRAGGPSNKGGTLANKRYQMSEKNYRAAGGTVNKPTP